MMEMKWLVVAAILVCLARPGTAGALKCTPASLDPACSDRQILDKPDAELGAECLVGSEWVSNCHSCRCSEAGVAACKKIHGCDDKAVPTPSSIAAVRECAPKSSWKSQCNECKCTEEGAAACTEKECPGQESEPLMRCAPESTWKNECNSCWCTADGRAMCTRMGCVTGITMNFEDNNVVTENVKNIPTEESPVKIDLGAKSATTQKNHTIVCVANRMFIRDCNTCWCNEDGTGFFCTRKVCIPELPDDATSDEEKPEELRVIKRECRPDEVFEIDCNMCRCNPDGKSFSCTRRACLSEPHVEQVQEENNSSALSRKVRGIPPAPPKTCEPSKKFRVDCNQCLCDDKGQNFSCTRIDCDAQNKNNNGGMRRKREVAQQAITQCSPGAVFEQDCNVCRCTSDGRHANCTLHKCKSDDHEKEGGNEHEQEGDPNFRCNPGEQFSRGCNDCTCTADGKSVYCTLRFCDKDLVPSL